MEDNQAAEKIHDNCTTVAEKEKFMGSFAGTFVMCLIGCLMFAFFLFSPLAVFAIIVLALLMAAFITNVVNQSEKIEELEKRISEIEKLGQSEP